MHNLRSVQRIPISLEKAWEFFSSPANLNVITPPSMTFETTSTDHGDNMYAGQLITYQVRPLLGIPLFWCTEITHVNAPNYFVDEQRFGPYAFWHHRHMLREIEGGVEMEDIVYYKLPMGLLGKLVEPILVRPKLKQIFDYRYNKLIELFGPFPAK